MAQSTDTPAEPASNPASEPIELNKPANPLDTLAAEIGASQPSHVGLLRRIGFGRTASAAPETPASADEPAFAAAAFEPESPPPPPPLADRPQRRLPLAAAVVLALALGALLGAGATFSLQRNNDAEALTQLASGAARDQAITAAAQDLQDSVARLRSEVAALKIGIEAAQRHSGSQIGRMAEGLARIEQRQVSLAAAPAVTGSVGAVTAVARQEPKADPKPEVRAEPKTATKTDTKTDTTPPVAEGWRVLDYYAGRAVVETPAGRLFDVGAGSNLPGLGRVQSIKRDQGQVVLTARNGTVAGIVDARRGPNYRQYR